MSDLLQRIDAHLNQCGRDDDSESLLVEARAEIARLRAELAATLEREDLAREERNTLDAMAQENAGDAAVDDTVRRMFVAALRIGPAEWGATAELPADQHLEHVKRSIQNTAKHFGQAGPQSMHGVYIAGTDLVIAHTGTSPNSPTHARILTALWNKFVQDAEAYHARAALNGEREA